MTLTAEQRTKVRETVFSRSNVPRVDRVDFSIRVGTSVPNHIHIVDVPPALIEIHPEWRGYNYFVVDEDIIIVDRSREIVAVVPAGSSQAAAGGGTSTSVAVDLGPEEIREVQIVLIERGLLEGEADGILGPNTREALIEFQRREQLQVTGRIDTRTVTALNLSRKVRVRDSGGSDRESSTVGQGRDPEGMRQETLRQEGSRQPNGSRDMSRERPGRVQRGLDGSQDRSTAGQGRPETPAPSAGQGMQPGQNSAGDSTVTKPSTTGQGGGEQQPNANQRMQRGQNGMQSRQNGGGKSP